MDKVLKLTQELTDRIRAVIERAQRSSPDEFTNDEADIFVRHRPTCASAPTGWERVCDCDHVIELKFDEGRVFTVREDGVMVREFHAWDRRTLVSSAIANWPMGERYSIEYVDPPWPYRVYGRATCAGWPRITTRPWRSTTSSSCRSGRSRRRTRGCSCGVRCPNLPYAPALMDAWGFTYKTVAFQSKAVSSLIVSPVEAHSKKPDVVRDRIVEFCGDVPRIELFARQTAPGWDSWGDGLSMNEPRKKADRACKRSKGDI